MAGRPGTVATPLRTLGVMTDASSLDEIWIEDEQLGDLLRVLPHIKVTGSGARRLGHVDADAPEADTLPFLRALKRELLGRADPDAARHLRTLLGLTTKAGYTAVPVSGSEHTRAGRAAHALVEAAERV
jgi:hypothetical protein